MQYMDNNDDIREILEAVIFIKDKMATKDELASGLADLKIELKRDIHGIHNRLDDELDKRKTLEVRVSRLEA